MRVVLVVPYDGVRHGLALLLDGMRGMRVVAETNSADEGVELVKRHSPDLVILDSERRRATQTITDIRDASPDCRLIVTVDDTTRREIEREFGREIAQDAVRTVYPDELFRVIRELH